MSYSLEEVAARIEIADLIARYTHAIDRGEWDTLDTVFTDEAVIDLRASGGICDRYEVVKNWWPGAMARFVMMQHYFTNQHITLSEDLRTGEMRSQVFNPMKQLVDGRRHKFFVGGVYDDKLANTDDGWRIVHRIWTIKWIAGDVPTDTSL